MFGRRALRIRIPDFSGVPSKTLPKFMEKQSETNWCWAALGASVGNYFYGQDSYTQCDVANTCLAKNNCCTNPAGCNEYWFVDKALMAANSYDTKASGTATFATIQSRIDNDEPVGIRVKWTGTGAHCMMITGYDENGEKITIQDPWHGTSIAEYSSYPADYQQGGTWTHTYFTTRQEDGS